MTLRVLKPSSDRSGYQRVILAKNKKGNNVKVHRLVAEAFLLNPENKPYVDHINNNVRDNNSSNLRYITPSENMQNSKLSIKNKFGCKGISFDGKKYIAQIRVDNICVKIGSYLTLEEAKIARIERATALFGEFINQCEKI
jgi:hypothetical protein